MDFKNHNSLLVLLDMNPTIHICGILIYWHVWVDGRTDPQSSELRMSVWFVS